MAPYSQDPFSPLHFYKFIAKTNLETIMIPSKFTGRYGRCLSNPVFLKSPDGKKWIVHWTKCDKEIWLLKGWKEFTKFYSLDVGYLVLFKYEGSSQIGVHIIDNSGLEIDYPWSMDDASNQEDNLDNVSDDTIVILDDMPPSLEENLDNLGDDTIEISDEMPQSHKANNNMPLSPSRPLKKMRSPTDEDVEMRSFNLQNMLVGPKTTGMKFQGTKLQKSSNANFKFSKKKSEGDTGTRNFNKSKCLNSEHRMKEVLTAAEKDKALEGARPFESDNPYFKMVMQPSYVCPKSCLPMPKEFAAKHLNQECEVVKLQTLDGRIWHAKYKIPKIGKGWRKFVKENGLKVGHVCAFEMIDHSSFKVHNLTDADKDKLKVDSSEKKQRSNMLDSPLEKDSPSQDKNPHFKQSSSMQDPPLEKASSSQSENPHFEQRSSMLKPPPLKASSFQSKKLSFTVMMTHAHIHGTSYVNVWFELAKAHLRNNTKSVTLSVQDKDWTVGYGYRNNTKQQSAEFSWGWKQFCKDNDLKVGDVCEFELTQKFKFQVTIFRG